MTNFACGGSVPSTTLLQLCMCGAWPLFNHAGAGLGPFFNYVCAGISPSPTFLARGSTLSNLNACVGPSPTMLARGWPLLQLCWCGTRPLSNLACVGLGHLFKFVCTGRSAPCLSGARPLSTLFARGSVPHQPCLRGARSLTNLAYAGLSPSPTLLTWGLAPLQPCLFLSWHPIPSHISQSLTYVTFCLIPNSSHPTRFGSPD